MPNRFFKNIFRNSDFLAFVGCVCLLSLWTVIPSLQFGIGLDVLYLSTVKGLKSFDAWLPYFNSWNQLCGVNEALVWSRPWITILVEKVLFLIFSASQVFLIHQILFSGISFVFLIKIFQKQVDRFYAVFFSIFTFFSFGDYHFRDYLFSKLGWSSALQMTSSLEILNVPFPSLSTVLFLVCFYFSTSSYQANAKRFFAWSFIWSLFYWVHPIDYLFGASYFAIHLTLRRRTVFIKTRYFVGALLLLISSFVVGSLLFQERLSGFEFEHFSFFEVVTPAYFGIYFMLPILLMLLVVWAKKIDLQEIKFRFAAIYACMVLELVLLVSFAIFLNGELESLRNRIALHLFHVLYLVPPLYFMVQGRRVNSSILQRHNFKELLSSLADKITGKFLKPICLLMILMFSVFFIHTYRRFSSDLEGKVAAMNLKEVEKVVQWVRTQEVNVDVVSSNEIIQVLVGRQSAQSSYWPRRFQCQQSLGEALKGIQRWSQLVGIPVQNAIQLPSVKWALFNRQPKDQMDLQSVSSDLLMEMQSFENLAKFDTIVIGAKDLKMVNCLQAAEFEHFVVCRMAR